MTPTAKTLTHLRQLGFVAAPCERFIAAVQRSRDLFGIGDVIGFHPRDRLALLVQCTTAAHVADRLNRIRQRPELPLLLRAGLTIEVWGWHKHGDRWHVQRVAVVTEDLAAAVTAGPPRRRRPRKGERQQSLFDCLVASGR